MAKKIQKPAQKSENDIIEKEKYTQFPLVKINFILMGCAALLIVLGFILIAGGSSSDDSFNPEVFSTTRIVVGPTLAFLGFVAMGVGIMWRKPKKD